MSNLNSLLSSSNFPVFFIRQILAFDLIEKVPFPLNSFFSLFKRFKEDRFLMIKFELTLPFANDLGKFRNRVLILLYFLIFELLVGQKPFVNPVSKHSKKKPFNISPLTATDEALFNKIDKFVFHKDLKLCESSNFLTIISLFLTKHAYSSYTVPSRLIKINRTNASYQFKLSPGLTSLEFLSQFDEFILSRVLLSFSFSNKFFGSALTDYFVSAFGLNVNHRISSVSSLSDDRGAASEQDVTTTAVENAVVLVPYFF